MKPTLYYVSDAYCCWCYGFSPVVNRIVGEHQESVDIEVHNGRMVGMNATIASFFRFVPDPLALHRRVAAYSGQSFGDKYLHHISTHQKSSLRMDSEVPARAMLVIEHCKPGSKLRAMALIQQAYYIEAMDLVDYSSYRPVCEDLNVNFGDFVKLMNSAEVKNMVLMEQSMVASLGISAFPALMLGTSEGRRYDIARGFMTYEQVDQNLKAALAECCSS